MSALWRKDRDSIKFFARGLRLYPKDELYKEMSFISYYFHWGNSDVMDMDHRSRRRWCQEISSINQSLSTSKQKKEKNIFELKPNH